MAEQKQKTEKVFLDREFTYQGQKFGPGEVDVPSEVQIGKEQDGSPITLSPAQDLRDAMKRAHDRDVAAGRKKDPDIVMVKPEAAGVLAPAGVQQVPHPQQPQKAPATAQAGGQQVPPQAGAGQQPPKK